MLLPTLLESVYVKHHCSLWNMATGSWGNAILKRHCFVVFTGRHCNSCRHYTALNENCSLEWIGIWKRCDVSCKVELSRFLIRQYTVTARRGMEVDFLFHVATAPSVPGLAHCWGFTITLRHTPHSVGLLWASDQPGAETSTWQHTTLPRGGHPCARRNLSPAILESGGGGG
jgi:hypothetical protein